MNPTSPPATDGTVSMRRMLVVRVMAILFIQLLLALALVQLQLRPQLIETATALNDTLATSFARVTERLVSQPSVMLNAAARRFGEQEQTAGNSKANRLSLLRQLIGSHRAIISAYILDAQGKVTDIAFLDQTEGAASNLDPGTIYRDQTGLDLSRSPIFRDRAITERHHSAVFLSPVTGRPMIGMTQSLAHGALIVAEISLTRLSEVINENGTANIQILIVDSEGNVIAHPDIKLARQSVILPREDLAVILSGRGKLNFGGQTMLVSAAPIVSGNLDWHVAVMRPADDVEAPASAIIRLLALLGLLLTFSSLALMVIVVRRLVGVVEILREHAKDIEAGRASAQPGFRIREFADLYQILQGMGATLSRREAELKRANEELEQRVEERTRALAGTNARLMETLQNLENTRGNLVRSERLAALGALVTGVAHELNTPIGNALLVGSALSDAACQFRDLPRATLTRQALQQHIDETVQGTEILVGNLKRAADLIASFKQLAADQHSGQRRVFSLHLTMAEMALSMMPTLRQTEHRLELDIPEQITMDGYPGPLSQIIINLINNAVLHAFEGKAQGHMRLQARQQGTQIDIRFSDDGCGMPATVLRRVFEPFFTTRLGKGGSGLGLHLAHTIVTELMGGSIHAESIQGSGTSFSLHIPVCAPTPVESVAIIGVPADVAADYARFLAGREVAVIEHFQDTHCRRDVLELALLLREIARRMPATLVSLVTVNDYRTGLERLNNGSLAALGTSVWRADLVRYTDSVRMSTAILKEGQSRVGLFCLASNAQAMQVASTADLRKLTVASSSDWSADWDSLTTLGVSRRIDCKTWREMVNAVSTGQADVLLAPFPNGPNRAFDVDGCTLVPVPHLQLALQGSRHFAASHTDMGERIAQDIFPAIAALVEDGSVERALQECGFFNPITDDLKMLLPEK